MGVLTTSYGCFDHTRRALLQTRRSVICPHRLPGLAKTTALQALQDRKSSKEDAPCCFSTRRHHKGASGLLTVILVGDSQLLAAMGATGSQHATAILCGHSLAETVLVHTATVVGLKCSFHLLFIVYLLLIPSSMDLQSTVWVAKLLIIFELTKNYVIFRP